VFLEWRDNKSMVNVMTPRHRENPLKKFLSRSVNTGVRRDCGDRELKATIATIKRGTVLSSPPSILQSGLDLQPSTLDTSFLYPHAVQAILLWRFSLLLRWSPALNTKRPHAP